MSFENFILTVMLRLVRIVIRMSMNPSNTDELVGVRSDIEAAIRSINS